MSVEHALAGLAAIVFSTGGAILHAFFRRLPAHRDLFWLTLACLMWVPVTAGGNFLATDSLIPWSYLFSACNSLFLLLACLQFREYPLWLGRIFGHGRVRQAVAAVIITDAVLTIGLRYYFEGSPSSVLIWYGVPDFIVSVGTLVVLSGVMVNSFHARNYPTLMVVTTLVFAFFLLSQVIAIIPLKEYGFSDSDPRSIFLQAFRLGLKFSLLMLIIALAFTWADEQLEMLKPERGPNQPKPDTLKPSYEDTVAMWSALHQPTGYIAKWIDKEGGVISSETLVRMIGRMESSHAQQKIAVALWAKILFTLGRGERIVSHTHLRMLLRKGSPRFPQAKWKWAGKLGKHGLLSWDKKRMRAKSDRQLFVDEIVAQLSRLGVEVTGPEVKAQIDRWVGEDAQDELTPVSEQAKAGGVT